jgi:hypothetical protein
MSPKWQKYDAHPEIGPLIQEYRRSLGHLEWLKSDLRTSTNIEDIVEFSHGQAEIKRAIDGLVRLEEEELLRERKDTAWMAITVLAALVGVFNVFVAFGLI